MLSHKYIVPESVCVCVWGGGGGGGGVTLFRIINLQSLLISCKFFPLNDILTIFPKRNVDLVKKNMSRSSQYHDLCTHCSTLVLDPTCQVSLKSVDQFWGRVLKGNQVFTIYGQGGHLRHAT